MVVAGLALLTIASCSRSSDGATAPATPQPGGPVVVAISIDGLNPDAIATLGRSGVPNLSRLMHEGAATLNARTAYERTITLPNHTGMMTGRRIDGAGGTSVTFNNDNGSTLAEVHGSYVPGMFDIAHDRGVKTALFAEKDKFAFLLRSWDDTHGAGDVTGADDGRGKLDLDAIEPASTLAGKVTKSVTQQDARLVFWHIAAPDAAGHATGWLSPVYLAAVRGADDQVGQLLEALDADPELEARTTILLTADHGGVKGARSHSDVTALADYRIPFIAWGRDVAPGSDLYDLNDDLVDPGTARPGYSGVQPVRNADIADTALALLGLPAVSDQSVVLQLR